MSLRKCSALLSAAVFLGSPASGQVLPIWNGGDGLWNNPANWSAGNVPNSATADVTIDSLTGTDSTVTMNLGARVGRLRLDAGDSLEVGETVSLILDDSGFAGAGEILVNGLVAASLWFVSS